jgi:DNA-binding LytR/AlgR family response regulator
MLSIAHISDNLPANQFIQIHKSYIIAIKHIEKTDNFSVWVKQMELPIGKTYRKNFFDEIANKKL